MLTTAPNKPLNRNKTNILSLCEGSAFDAFSGQAVAAISE